jgi:hypothetical protein
MLVLPWALLLIVVVLFGCFALAVVYLMLLPLVAVSVLFILAGFH